MNLDFALLFDSRNMAPPGSLLSAEMGKQLSSPPALP